MCIRPHISTCVYYASTRDSIRFSMFKSLFETELLRIKTAIGYCWHVARYFVFSLVKYFFLCMFFCFVVFSTFVVNKDEYSQKKNLFIP